MERPKHEDFYYYPKGLDFPSINLLRYSRAQDEYIDYLLKQTKPPKQQQRVNDDKTEKWFKEKLRVPENWDRFDYEMARYSFNDMVEYAEQYSDQEVKRAIREHILIEMIKDDEESGSYDVNTESDEK